MLAEHEKDAWQAAKREQRERDATINAHLKERGKLQERITTLRQRQSHDRRVLAREIGQTIKAQRRDGHAYHLRQDRDLNQEQDRRNRRDWGPSLSF
jgi:hypothetical protein